jgi:ELWxxDGT repeat protein
MWRKLDTAARPIRRRSPFPSRLALAMALGLAAAAAAEGQTAYLVRDTALGLSDYPEDAQELTSAGSQVFFLGNIGDVAEGLWVTDGTTTGTQALAQYCGVEDSAICKLSFVGAVGNVRFFVTGPFSLGTTLVSTDGTRAGTFALDPIGLPQWSGDVATPEDFAVIGKTLCFGAGAGAGLWRSDGTLAGTVEVAKVGAGPLVTFGGKVYYFDPKAAAGALWRSDCTSAGTAQFAALASSAPSLLTAAGSHLFFIAGAGTPAGNQLWATDEIQHCSAGCESPIHVQAVGSTGYFAGQGSPGAPVLWQTDGTVAGTKRYGAPTLGAVAVGSALDVASLGNRLVFTGPSPDLNLEVTDGTAAGTRQLNDSRAAGSADPRSFITLGDLLFFSSFAPPPDAPASPADLSYLWQSAGSAATTVPVPGIPPSGEAIAAAGGSLFYALENQLWRTDGTASGARQLLTLPSPFLVARGVAFQGRCFFIVGTNGEPSASSLWQSDGTVAGTVKVADIALADELTGPWVAGGYLFFAILTNESTQLWRSDGTAQGTLPLLDTLGLEPEVTAAGGRIYFAGPPPEVGAVGLWQTDGTVAGTVPVPAILPPSGALPPEGPEGLTAVGNTLLFFTRTYPSPGAAVVSLWRSDGTAEGTFAFASFTPAASAVALSLSPMAALGGQAFFAMDDGVHGIEPWVTDGTSGGTRLLRDINAGALDSGPIGLTVAAGKVYFTADDSVHGSELWESDGTTAGTRLVQDILPGPAGSSLSGLIQAGGLLFFAAADGLTGDELWALPLSGQGCQPGPTDLCLLDERFQVEARWLDPQGNSGAGQAVALTADTGTFWFFSPDNVEVVAKMIDGRLLDDSFWFFYGALSDVEYWLTVTDTTTGAARRYHNLPGQLASVGDTAAFGAQGTASIVAAPETRIAVAATATARAPEPAASAAAPSAAAPAAGGTAACQAGTATLCLQDNRFAVTVAWQDFSGGQGAGTASDLTADTGYFWFFDAANVELVLKVLDGRAVNCRFWVFYGALSDVAYTITVRDTMTGAVRTYTNPAGQFASIADTVAF